MRPLRAASFALGRGAHAYGVGVHCNPALDRVPSADLAVGIASFGAQNLLVQALFQRSEYSMLELVFTRLEISARSRQNLHKLEALP